MTRVRLLLQKRPGFGPLALIAHIGIVLVLSLRYRQWCPYSHSELEIDGVCHSSTTDSGVRSARLNTSGKEWTVYDAPHVNAVHALQRYHGIKGLNYDWLGASWWALPFARQRKGAVTCFEAVAIMLGMPEPHKQGPRELIAWLQNGRVTA